MSLEPELMRVLLMAFISVVVSKLPQIIFCGMVLYALRVSRGEDGKMQWKEYERAILFMVVCGVFLVNKQLQTEYTLTILLGVAVGERLGSKLIDNAKSYFTKPAPTERVRDIQEGSDPKDLA